MKDGWVNQHTGRSDQPFFSVNSVTSYLAATTTLGNASYSSSAEEYARSQMGGYPVQEDSSSSEEDEAVRPGVKRAVQSVVAFGNGKGSPIFRSAQWSKCQAGSGVFQTMTNHELTAIRTLAAKLVQAKVPNQLGGVPPTGSDHMWLPYSGNIVVYF
ncbi:hypothetical protein KUF71_007491 [Frankliniella fusca]|uniref:Uncharacterized protein n=1 Tax=Frankliniella fusca TaxID=407009 RepID=A0AAE1I1Y5_9NEOP|nr:hypothetical protein KUF71_007488 [Frankliniella fusca]KAK3931676.1 hypothetical protein KUF71_007491 [Frankliniella fusca]